MKFLRNIRNCKEKRQQFNNRNRRKKNKNKVKVFAKNCVDDDDELYIRGFVESVVKTRKKPEAEPNQTPLSKLATSKIREKKRAKTNEDIQTDRNKES